MSVCPRCGWSSPEGQSYCAACGCELKGRAARPVVPPPPPDGDWSTMPPPPPEPPVGLPQAPPVVPPPATVPPGAPPTYLAGAILVTMLCCMPFGIAAIIYASQVNTKLAAGDLDGARAASASARTWIIVSALVGGLVNLVIVALAILGNLAK